MSPKPRTPDDYEVPAEVNGWSYNPDASSNGHVWHSDDETKAVILQSPPGNHTYLEVSDERTLGIGGRIRIREDEYESVDDIDDRIEIEESAVVDAIEHAVDWMESMHPDDWAHPSVLESVFDAPPGYELVEYHIGQRDTQIYYERTDCDASPRQTPDEYTIETCPFLYIHSWHSSGKTTIALAPWTGAHNLSSKHPEIEEIVDTPENCGLDRALRMTRVWVSEQTANSTAVSPDRSVVESE